MQESAYAHSFLYAYVGSILRMHREFQKPKKDKFSALMLRFGTNPTSSESRSKPLFYTITSLTWYIFKTHRNPIGKH